MIGTRLAKTSFSAPLAASPVAASPVGVSPAAGGPTTLALAPTLALMLVLALSACSEPRSRETCITDMKAHFQVVADLPRPSGPGPAYWIASMELFSATAASADRDGCTAEVGVLLDAGKAAADDLVALYTLRVDEEALAELDQMERSNINGRVQVATDRLSEALVGLEQQGLR